MIRKIIDWLNEQLDRLVDTAVLTKDDDWVI